MLPLEREEAKAIKSEYWISFSSIISKTSLPTFPVAPTTAILGFLEAAKLNSLDY